MSADLNLAFADFAAAFSEDAEGALCDLQALFLDRDTCLARIEFLRTLGRYHFIPPRESLLACGDYGEGALAPPADIVAAVLAGGG